MRLLVTTNGIWHSGAQVATNEFLSFLAKLNDIEIRIVSCLGGKYALSPDNAEVHRVPCWNVGTLLQMKPDGDFERLVRWADVVWIATSEFAVAERVKRIKKLPIVAHLHSYEPICPIMWFSYGFYGVCGRKCSPWLLVRCKQSTNRFFAELGLIDKLRAEVYWLLILGKGPLDYFRWRRVIDSVVDSVDVFVAVSNATRDVVVSHLPEVRDRIEVVYNPVAHRPWRYVSSLPERRGNYIFYAGGANLNKGPHILLKAFKLLRERGIDVELVMTGTAGTWVEALARRYGVGQGVRFLGRLPEGEYFRLIAGAGATVLPSVWPEPLPTVAVESVSLGVPVVGSGLGGIPEIVDRYGAVAPPLPERIAEAVEKVLKTHYGREDMRKYAFEKFGDGNVERFLSLLASLVK